MRLKEHGVYLHYTQDDLEHRSSSGRRIPAIAARRHDRHRRFSPTELPRSSFIEWTFFRNSSIAF